MSRLKRLLQSNFSYHITVRCNNREFRLTRLECRKFLLYAIKRLQEKYSFKLYAICVMSNHIHYLLEPDGITWKAEIWAWRPSPYFTNM